MQPVMTMPASPASPAGRRLLERWARGSGVLVALVGLLVLAGWTFDVAALKSVLPGFVTMKVNTALCFILGGLALGLLSGREETDRSAARRVGQVCAAAVALVGLVTLGEWVFGWNLPLDNFLFVDSPEAVGTTQPGRMAAQAALSFLLLGSALLLLNTRRGVVAAQGLAALAGWLGLFGLVGHALGIRELVGVRLPTVMALHTAAAFLVFSAGVLGALGARPFKLKPGWVLLTALVMFTALIGASGWLYFQQQQTEARRAAQETLATIADMKVGQIALWMKERRSDAETSFDKLQARQFLAEPDNAAVHGELLQWMTTFQRVYDYRAVILLDSRGAVRLAVPADAAVPDEVYAEQVQAALRAREVVFADLHRGQANQPIHLSFLIPIGVKPQADQPADGVMLFQIDPRQYLYPLMRNWPAPSRTAETILIRREGNEVVYLNELRHHTNAAPVLRLPLDPKLRLPAAMAVEGEEGEVEGRDYRGIPCLAAMRKIPGTPWFMVAKVDAAEIYAPLREEAWTISLVVGLLLLVAVLGVGLLWRQQKLLFARRELAERQQAEKAQRESEWRFRTLANTGQALIWTAGLDKGCDYFNEVWMRFTGRTLEQELGNGWTEGVHPDDMARCMSVYVTAFDQREAFSMDYRLRHASGEYRWLQDDGTPRFDDQGNFLGYIGHCLDITARKRVEEVQVFLAQTSSGTSAEPFFNLLARYLATSLGMDFICIDRLKGDGLNARTLAVWRDGKFEDNVTYALKDTPCGDVVGETVCYFPANVCQFFPRDQLLKDLQAESYAGVTLFGRTGQPIGLIAVIGRRPLTSRAQVEATLKLVSIRAAGELEWLEAAAALRESEDRFRGLTQSAPVGVFETDPKGDCLFVNNRWCQITGLTVAEAMGKGWRRSLHPEDRDRVFDECNQSVKERRPFQLEYRFQRPDGSSAWVFGQDNARQNSAGEITGYIGTITDITERRQAEAARRTIAEQMRSLFENAPFGIFHFVPEGRLLKANPAVARMLGYASPEALIAATSNLPTQIYADPGKRPQIVDAMMQREGWVHYDEVIWRRQDGRLITVEMNGRKVLDGGGAVAYLEGFVADITQRKLAEEQLQAAQRETTRLLAVAVESRQALLGTLEDQNEAEDEVRRLNAELEQRVRERTAQLEAANKELEAFSYSVSHDLRAPLRSIDGFSRILLEDYAAKLDEEGQDSLRRVRAASQRMGDLIDDMLKLSRVTRNEMQPGTVDLSALAHTIMAELEQEEPARRVEWVIADGLAVQGDAALLRVAMQNLLGNAWKFTSKQPQARIEVGATQRDRVRTHFVRDNGAGFDMAYAGKLFGAFQRQHNAAEFPGTGIGLATVQRVLHRHGGRIWAESAVGQGATFFFTLPEHPATTGADRP